MIRAELFYLYKMFSYWSVFSVKEQIEILLYLQKHYLIDKGNISTLIFILSLLWFIVYSYKRRFIYNNLPMNEYILPVAKMIIIEVSNQTLILNWYIEENY